MNKVQEMIAILTKAEADYIKFLDGNNAAAARVRKHLMEVRNAAQDLRLEITSIKNSRKK